jgi:hypothetical protein
MGIDALRTVREHSLYQRAARAPSAQAGALCLNTKNACTGPLEYLPRLQVLIVLQATEKEQQQERHDERSSKFGHSLE